MESIKELTESMNWVLHHAERSVEKATKCKVTCPDISRVFEQLTEEMLKEYKQLHNTAERCIEEKTRQMGGSETEYMRGMKAAYAALHEQEVKRYEEVERKLKAIRE